MYLNVHRTGIHGIPGIPVQVYHIPSIPIQVYQVYLNVHRTVEGKLETDVYRKPTHTDIYLSSDSHHPVSHKR